MEGDSAGGILVLWYLAKLLLAGYLVLGGKRGTPLTTILPATIVEQEW